MLASMNPPQLIVPTPQHADSLVRLGRSTFEDTFIGVSYYTRELVEGYTQTAFTTESVLSDLANPKKRLFLALIDGEAAGYAVCAEREPATCLNGLHGLYLERLYVDARFKRRGLGLLLLNAVHNEARTRAYHHVWLSVWEYNHAAQAFYKAQGYRQAGDWEWPFESLGKRYVDRDLVYCVDL